MAADSSQPVVGRWWKRVGWLVLIWLLSVGALALVALMVKFLMRMAGLAA